MSELVPGDGPEGALYERGNVTFHTTMGNITLELYWDHAPKTCRNFYELAKRQYYTHTIFHRVVPVGCVDEDSEDIKLLYCRAFVSRAATQPAQAREANPYTAST
eukprot:Gregarina_sp_Pseudo_9__1560@NODE_2047_length_1181_cov_22_619089_g1890_i0_p3_GENE_NODE_2047_length_1181_cov_22_619089_g1890_i0NODE_2047_length_1181_cov_22_619089_g1890_i0_p3_ORF_typecomplete_len113_score7_48Pro_isomerase/PF00160_21/1_1e14DUF3830/PF12903_7/91DUF3830/PF12903_7/0_18_NODE_2047_length_1181_cov_22_619089_g1890_i027341